MCTVLVAVRHQLHHYQRFECNHAILGRIFHGLNVRRRQGMIGASLFASEQQVDGFGNLSVVLAIFVVVIFLALMTSVKSLAASCCLTEECYRSAN